MKNLLIFSISLFLCGIARGQIYTPQSPTIYGHKELRMKPTLVLHLPTSTDSSLNTNDATPQIRVISEKIRQLKWWNGYWRQVGEGTGGGSGSGIPFVDTLIRNAKSSVDPNNTITYKKNGLSYSVDIENEVGDWSAASSISVAKKGTSQDFFNYKIMVGDAPDNRTYRIPMNYTSATDIYANNDTIATVGSSKVLPYAYYNLNANKGITNIYVGNGSGGAFAVHKEVNVSNSTGNAVTLTFLGNSLAPTVNARDASSSNYLSTLSLPAGWSVKLVSYWHADQIGIRWVVSGFSTNSTGNAVVETDPSVNAAVKALTAADTLRYGQKASLAQVSKAISDSLKVSGRLGIYNRGTLGFAMGSWWNDSTLALPRIRSGNANMTIDTTGGDWKFTVVGGGSGGTPMSIATGTSGSDVNITKNTAGDTSFINIPSMAGSGVTRGLLTSGTQAIAGFKQFGAGFITGTSTTSANLYAMGTNIPIAIDQTTSSLLVEGGTTYRGRIAFMGSGNSVLGAGNVYSNTINAASPITEATSGTHPLLANHIISSFPITDGAGSTALAASLYVEGAPTGITATNGLWAAYFGGNTNITNGGLTINQTNSAAALAITLPSTLGTSVGAFIQGPASTTVNDGKMFQIGVTGEAGKRMSIWSDGSYGIGDGAGATRDWILSRIGASVAKISSDRGTGDASLVITSKLGVGVSTLSPTFNFENNSGTNRFNAIFSSSETNGPIVKTATLITPTFADQRIGTFEFNVATEGIGVASNAALQSFAPAAHTIGSSQPADLRFYTTPKNSIVARQTLRIGSEGQISNTEAEADASAVVDFSDAAIGETSLKGGMIPPKVTQAQRLAIASPADGLVVYQFDGTTGMYLYKTGTGWGLLGGTGASSPGTYSDPFIYQNVRSGGVLRAETIGINPMVASSALSLAPGQIRLTKIQVDTVITVARFVCYMRTTGNYVSTAMDNGMALYSFNGTTFTRITRTDTNADFWKGTASDYLFANFTDAIPQTLNPGTAYYVATLYNASGTATTVPQILGSAAQSNQINGVFGSTYKLSVFASGTTFPATIAATSTFTTSAPLQWVGLATF